ncbi:Ig-like domain-containing protein [Cohnella cellulosilytica]|uniref:Ig-like domain-containing protein n=1 Tax=Cohnella cellulosilytica TaxID=986710 RepID=A0ABW2FJ17_9BACL
MLLFGGVSALGFQPAYAADRTAATWSELTDAFQTAPSGDTIVLSADITQTSGSLLVPAGASRTLDLNGHKLSITALPLEDVPAVRVYDGSSLTINDRAGGGVLNATGSPGGWGAGIGSNSQQSAGTLIINGGTVNATGGNQGAAGIGGGFSKSGGTVIINGGVVYATGFGGAAGIGGGIGGAGGTVIINGGNVNATGNNGGAGIGAGYSQDPNPAAGAAVTITGGTVTVSAGNTPGYSAIGGKPFGSLSNSGSGTIVIPSGQVLIIPSGITFENAGKIEGGGTIKGEGIIQNTGTINSSVSGVAVEGNAYDLTFDLNGAPGAAPSSLHVLASTVQAAGLSLTVPTPPGYEFDGWYTSSGVPFTATTPIGSITSTASATLYAKWKDFKIESVVPISDIHVSYDTPLSAIALPAIVNVTLSNGETKAAAVAWDGGTPAYNGTQPGTYTLTGTLTVPSGSTNPDNRTASVSVVVGGPRVTSVEALSDINVLFATPRTAIGLPATVNVTLISGETASASVAWDTGTPFYNFLERGTYTFTGTLVASADFVNPDGITASVRVVVGDPPILSVSTLSDKHVPYGTLISAIGLPATVNVTLRNGEVKTASVTWNGGAPAYDGTRPGSYSFTGTLATPADSTNPDNKTASITVVVEDPTVTSVAALLDIHVPYGTLISAIGLPTTVDVTLSSGETKAASVSWNGGSPTYNGTQPGSYSFTGTLAAPAGSTNPGGLTASVHVIVEDPTVTSVAALFDIHVPYGTELEDIGLPTTVDVTLSSGDTGEATVTWNGGIPAYSGTQPGSYSFMGTLAAPAGSTNPDNRTASITVVVEDPTVTSVSMLPDIHVPYGTELEDIELPAKVDVTLSSGDTEEAAVTWNGGIPAYNGTQPGSYSFTGTLAAPAGSTNPDNRTASITVVVEDPTVTSVSTLSDIHVPYGTELEAIGLPAKVDVTLSSGDTEEAAVTWNGGTPTYSGTQPGTYVFKGTLTAPAGSTNPDNRMASVNVVVEDPTVTSVNAIPDIHIPYGTALEDIGLPATVDVTLSSGDIEHATVTWNGGVPAYNGTQPGTYTFTGTLAAPAGSTNPSGLTASVNVIVEDPTVTSVAALLDIHVPYGTLINAIGLPATVDVTLSSGETKAASVSWNGGVPAYNGTQPSTYVFTGTLAAPAGSTNPDNRTASITVVVEDPTVTSVSTLSDIHVPYGTELVDVGLPTTVNVTLSSGDTDQATITWNGGTPTYSGTQPGTYTFAGTLTAPVGSTNPDNRMASVNVIVEDPTVTSVNTLSDIHVPYGTELVDVELPTTVDVTLSSGDTEQAAVIWNGGTPTYSGTQPGTYVFTGTLTAPVGSTNPDNRTASITVVVEDPTVTSVGTLSDIHVPYGTELEDIGLPTTVDVTLSSGDTEQAAVTWNGGTPAYNGTQPGTYLFTGTLTAPAGSTNPDNRMASVNVIVEDPTVISVDAISDIYVPYGTELEDIGLPTTVDVILSSGDTEQATVMWDGGTPAYNGTQPGTYTFTGTLTAPAGSTNPDNKTASVHVIVGDPTVISVAPLSDIRVSYGTRLDNVKLPTTVDVSLSSGDTEQATVTWDGGDPAYSGTKSGRYTFTGTLTPPAGTANPDNLTASVIVIVDSARSSGAAPVPLDTSTRVYCGAGGCTVSLGDQVEVTVPPKATSLPFYLTLERLEEDELELPDGAQWLSQVFSLTWSDEDQPLLLPMTLLIRLESAKIGEGRRAALFAYDESTGKWSEVNGSLAGEVFTAQTDKFADFAVLSVAKQVPPSQPQPEEEPGTLFNDITGHWAEAEIKAAVAKGIVTGYQDGTFRPNQQVSRVEFTAMLNRALRLIGSGGASESPQPEFADAASIPAWARSSVAEATAQGLIRGFEDGTFRPGELISRTEMAAIAARALHLAQAPEAKPDFADADEIPAWAREAVAAVQQAGLMKGMNGNRFAPRTPVTRAEAAGLIIRMMERE